MKEKRFGADFFRRLETWRVDFLRGREKKSGNFVNSTEIGESREFKDHQGYSPGDDFRQIDWNVYARMGKLFIRQYQVEEGSSVAIVLDASASMGNPESDKWNFTVRLAGALGVLSLANAANLRVWICRGTENSRRISFEGKGQISSWLEMLESAETESVSQKNLIEALQEIPSQNGKAQVFFLSDFLFEEGPERVCESLSRLRAKGFELHVIQVLDRSERNPQSQGLFELEELEGKQKIELTLGEKELSLYRKEFEDYLHGLGEHFRKSGIHFQSLAAEKSLEQALLEVSK